MLNYDDDGGKREEYEQEMYELQDWESRQYTKTVRCDAPFICPYCNADSRYIVSWHNWHTCEKCQGGFHLVAPANAQGDEQEDDQERETYDEPD